ncbi:NlpC/P60 family protein [Stenotrophomonas sp. MMGLT7]|uniref:NlpC/P60 family protein n=1 Tax=Stenotrophomonas sp. MMGLT7 TaxID=2901227 RepID=UPI001E2EA73D|nr:NlpC/P60 family protein [Stenotrophomonas sp. MMGLT7]MCD7096931.1 C40 family peptidase [Stenotrophomonas sp. MMGLT7]
MSLGDYVGIPYEGRMFCRTLAARVLAEQGIPFPPVHRPQDAAHWRRVARGRRFDVVVLRRPGGEFHVGVCLGDGRFLHVEEGSRSGCDDLASPLFAPAIEGIYRYEGPRQGEEAACST